MPAKKSPYELMRRNAAIMRGLARMYDKPTPEGDPLFDGPPEPPEVRRTRKPPTGPSESDVQSAVLDYLRRVVKAQAIRYNSGAMQESGPHARYVSFNDAPGHSDIAGTLPGGRAFYIEVKRPGQKATPKQAAFLARMASAGALVGVVHSVDELIALLKG